MKHLLKFYRYIFDWENYLLLARAIEAARLVRRHLPERAVSPQFGSALTAVDRIYLPPQTGWRISEEEKIVRFAAFVIAFPVEWGKCVHQSLIVYRLLNGYGIPAKICFGVRRDEPRTDGHAWVEKLSEPERPFSERADPREKFTVVYTSRLPETC
ncbi:MAG: lasso peptide biosynthesis B2 protein [Acidobacteria bacterium]|nr:lasso peptide biosynthesis B2 protein [Acidobacteriota bacterium]